MEQAGIEGYDQGWRLTRHVTVATAAVASLLALAATVAALAAAVSATTTLLVATTVAALGWTASLGAVARDVADLAALRGGFELSAQTAACTRNSEWRAKTELKLTL